MSGPLLAEFRDPAGLISAANLVHAAGHRLLDAFTPFPVEGVAKLFEVRPSRIRVPMLVAGAVTAAIAYGLQWWSAVIDYPINTGGRPLHSWPVFLLVPFEVGVLGAAVAGFVAFIRCSGLPRLHHPVFDAVGFERASEDRFFLLAEDSGTPNGRLRHLLEGAGAVRVCELRDAAEARP